MGPRFRIAWGALLVAGALILWPALREAEEARESVSLEATSVEDAARLGTLDARDRVQRREEAPATSSAGPESAAPSTEVRDLVVRVLDASRQPVDDIGVELWTAPAAPGERGEPPIYRREFAVEGALPRHGMRVPAEALATAFAKARDARAAGREFGVYVGAPNSIAKCTHLELREAELPSRDVELELGPSGFLRVDVRKPDGTPHEEEVSVVVRIPEPQMDLRSPQRDRLRPAVLRQMAKQRERLRVPVVASLRVSLAMDYGRGFLGEKQEIAGPRTEGEEVVLRVSLRAARILVGRLLSLAGEPLVEQGLLASYELSAMQPSQNIVRTDAAGRFRFVLQNDPPPKHIAKLRLFPQGARAVRWNVEELENHPHAVLEHVELPETPVADLGDIQIQPTGKLRLIAGIVVDRAGAAIEGATVDAFTGSPGQPLTRGEILSDHEGRFAIFHERQVPSLRVVARKHGYFLESSVEALLGESEVRLVLHRGAAIEGTVRVPEGFPLSELEIHRVHDGRTQERLAPAVDGSFRFEGCAPGAHTLAFQLAPWKPVLELAGLAVAGEELCADPRLREIDLRRLLTTLRIRALDARGEPLAQASLELSVDGTKWQAKPIRTDASARAALGLPIEVQAVAISLHGGAPTVVRCAAEEQEVRLAGPLAVELALHPAPELPADLRLYASLELLGPDGVAPRPPVFTSSEAAFEAGRSTHRVPLAARYGVRWAVRTTDASPYRAVLAGETLAIEVQPATEPQRIAVSPPLDALRAALTKLGR
ncbi:MAG: carboxypeptidase regulatory-like domain-containing protein [Planctomycetes bacterium]|nr:carboxypeptidase regulatory-like domain-containing protein [Planctomycetota bacterium]